MDQLKNGKGRSVAAESGQPSSVELAQTMMPFRNTPRIKGSKVVEGDRPLSIDFRPNLAIPKPEANIPRAPQASELFGRRGITTYYAFDAQYT